MDWAHELVDWEKNQLPKSKRISHEGDLDTKIKELEKITLQNYYVLNHKIERENKIQNDDSRKRYDSHNNAHSKIKLRMLQIERENTILKERMCRIEIENQLLKEQLTTHDDKFQLLADVQELCKQ